jgi:hypothetical protein
LGAQLHPSSFVGCQFPDAAPVCEDESQSFSAPRRSRPTVLPPPTYRVRLLGPEPSHLPVLLFRTPDESPAENGSSLHFIPKVGIPLTRNRLPRVTGLVSYPSHCIFFSQADDPVSRCLPRFRTLLCALGYRRLPGAFLLANSFRDGRVPFSPTGCDADRIPRPYWFVHGRGTSFSTTLTHSSNVRSVTDCVRLRLD